MHAEVKHYLVDRVDLLERWLHDMTQAQAELEAKRPRGEDAQADAIAARAQQAIDGLRAEINKANEALAAFGTRGAGPARDYLASLKTTIENQHAIDVAHESDELATTSDVAHSMVMAMEVRKIESLLELLKPN